MLGALLFVVLVWGFFAFAVAMDAARRGHHAEFWLVTTFLTGVFGAAAYAVVVLTTDGGTDDEPGDEPSSETVRVCPSCSSIQGGSQHYCGECGAELGPGDEHPLARRFETGSRWYCGNCSSRVDRDADSCPGCGAVF